jgi:hypothetical protein
MCRLRHAGQSANPRATALVQLLRIAEGGAYAALVSGPPARAPCVDQRAIRGDRTALDAQNVVSCVESDIVPDLAERSGPSAASAAVRDCARHATRLTSGVTRWRRQLDAIIASAACRGIRQIDAPTREVR